MWSMADRWKRKCSLKAQSALLQILQQEFPVAAPNNCLLHCSLCLHCTDPLMRSLCNDLDLCGAQTPQTPTPDCQQRNYSHPSKWQSLCDQQSADYAWPSELWMLNQHQDTPQWPCPDQMGEGPQTQRGEGWWESQFGHTAVNQWAWGLELSLNLSLAFLLTEDCQSSNIRQKLILQKNMYHFMSLSWEATVEGN